MLGYACVVHEKYSQHHSNYKLDSRGSHLVRVAAQRCNAGGVAARLRYVYFGSRRTMTMSRSGCVVAPPELGTDRVTRGGGWWAGGGVLVFRECSLTERVLG